MNCKLSKDLHSKLNEMAKLTRPAKYLFITDSLRTCNELYNSLNNHRVNNRIKGRLTRYVQLHTATRVFHVVEYLINSKENIPSVDDTLYIYKMEAMTETNFEDHFNLAL